MALNPKQDRFWREYLIDFNATQAAIRAGYSANSAASQGERLLRHGEIQAALSAGMAAAAVKAEITVDRTILEYRRIALADIRKAVRWRSDVQIIGADDDGNQIRQTGNELILVDSDDLDDDTAAAISEVQLTDKGGLRIKFHSKPQALDGLAKYLRMWVEQHEHTGRGGGPIETKNLTDDQLDALIARITAPAAG